MGESGGNMSEVRLIDANADNIKTVESGNKFYSIDQIWKTVSEQEFADFIQNYPRKLQFDVCGIAEPPSCSYNDFELANRWPWSVVANFDGGEPNAYYGWDYKRTYQICTNTDECFAAKTGYVE
jgi:hypothetical protein